jgi:hypothetical protein
MKYLFQEIKLLICIQEVADSNLDRENDDGLS